MAKIIETLTDRRGNVIPNTQVVAREANNPSGDVASATSDAVGNYEIDVGLSGTAYDLWITSITTVDASNYIGRRLSGGDVVSSFVLCDDASWKTEHYGSGEAQTCGKHKNSTHDSILLRTGGYLKTTDAFHELRLGSDTDILRFTKSGVVSWLTPKVSGSGLTDIGLMEGPGGASDKTNFYFGTAKARYINSAGEFILDLGFFKGLTTFDAESVFNFKSTFIGNDQAKYPRVNVYSAPGTDTFLTPKKYVDDSITAALTTLNKIYQNDSSIEVVDDNINPGRILTTLDGNIIGVIENNNWAFGGNFTASSFFHLRRASAQTAIRLERQGTGASTSIFDENSVGTFTGTEFFFKSSNTNAGVIDTSQRFGFGVFTGLTEKVNIGGNLRLQNTIHFTTKGTPADPGTEESKMYLKQRDSANNEMAVKIKKNNAIAEVLITSPEGVCSVCGTEGSARDPYFDTKRGKMIISFYCGHKFEIDMNFKPVEN